MLMWQCDARFARKCVNGLTPLRYLYSATGVSPFVFAQHISEHSERHISTLAYCRISILAHCCHINEHCEQISPQTLCTFGGKW